MANYKYQHYLPVGHQKLFSSSKESSGFIYKYDKRKSVVYNFPLDPRKHGGKKNLYSYPDDLVTPNNMRTYLEQNYFCQDEKFIEVVRKIAAGTEINNSDCYQITKYIANINNRHPENLNSSTVDLTKIALETMFFGDRHLVNFFVEAGIKFQPGQGPEFQKVCSLSKMLSSIKINLQELCNINMNFLISKEEEFILSDNPLVCVNRENKQISTVKLSPETDYYLPLSKAMCVLLNGYGQTLNSCLIDKEIVQMINMLQIHSANSFVIGSSSGILKDNLNRNKIGFTEK